MKEDKDIIVVEIPHQREVSVIETTLENYLSAIAGADNAPQAIIYQNLKDAQSSYGEDLPGPLAELLETGPAREFVDAEGEQTYHKAGEGPNLSEALIAYARHDLSSLEIFDSLDEAEQYYRGTPGHGQLDVLDAISALQAANQSAPAPAGP